MKLTPKPRAPVFLLLALHLAVVAAPPARAAVSRADGGIRFTYTDAAATTVAWAGDWNGWNQSANPLAKDAAGVWSVLLPLPAGEHSYKFVVDGQWVADPENPVTRGEFGNSVVTIAADGSLVGAATAAGAAGAGPPPGDRDPAQDAADVVANTPYSAKLEFHGRGIGLYEAKLNRETSRYELRRPQINFDLDTGIRISEVLTGRWLLKIDAEAENRQFYQTQLNFDRGNLTFRKPGFEIFGYDNEDAGTWDDPLHLVGDIGIYGYGYGYGRQGFRIRPTFAGFRAELQYADNFVTGGETYPAFNDSVAEVVGDGFASEPDGGGGYRLVPGGYAGAATVTVSDGNEDLLALRLRRDLGPTTVGLLGRSDRGFNLSSGAFVFARDDDEIEALIGNFSQTWYAWGGEVAWRPGPPNLELEAEALTGRLAAEFTESAQRQTYRVVFDDTGKVASVPLVASGPGGNESVVLDRSRRAALGGRWSGALLGAPAGLDLRATYMDHDDRPGLDDFAATDPGRRSMKTVRGRWDQDWGGVLPWSVRTILDVEWSGFEYRPDDPWDAQFWFTARNFWLEHGYDLVGPDRIVMLGGANVWSFRPELVVPILPERNFAFEYAGRIHTNYLSVRPKYLESFFRLGYDLTRAFRLQTDTRWVKYDDPVLGLGHGYVSHFAEALYTFAPGVQISLSYGADPWVLDRSTNLYAYRGRDDVLAANGVSATGARTAFLDQGPVIDAAERALRDQRRIAVEGIVRF